MMAEKTRETARGDRMQKRKGMAARMRCPDGTANFLPATDASPSILHTPLRVGNEMIRRREFEFAAGFDHCSLAFPAEKMQFTASEDRSRPVFP
jgi:hypothetical protein